MINLGLRDKSLAQKQGIRGVNHMISAQLQPWLSPHTLWSSLPSECSSASNFTIHPVINVPVINEQTKVLAGGWAGGHQNQIGKNQTTGFEMGTLKCKKLLNNLSAMCKEKRGREVERGRRKREVG